jgi:cytoskeletal protein CcmA (bactofilin family)
VGDHATSGTVRTVNGSITVGSHARLSGSVVAVNGALAVRDGADVAGAVSNVMGDIRIEDAHVGRGIKTVAGDIEIVGKSHVEGGIAVEKPSGQLPSTRDKPPHIVIGPGVIVQGELRFERPVRLDVSNRASIGPVVGATPVTFTGDEPPA